MTVVRRADARRTATPNATMTTCASPTQGGAHLALWRVEMEPGASGPLHAVDVEQVWTVLAGSASVDIAGDAHDLGAGDTLVLPPDVPRRVRATAAFSALVAAPAGAHAVQEGAEAVVAPWWA